MMNRNGQKPESLRSEPEPVGPQFVSAVGDDSITRFDKPKKSRNKNRGKNKAGKPAAETSGQSSAEGQAAPVAKPRPEGGNNRRQGGPRRNGNNRPQRPRGDRNPEQKPKTDA